MREWRGGTRRSEERAAHGRASAKWVRGAWHHAYKKARNFVRVGGWVFMVEGTLTRDRRKVPSRRGLAIRVESRRGLDSSSSSTRSEWGESSGERIMEFVSAKSGDVHVSKRWLHTACPNSSRDVCKEYSSSHMRGRPLASRKRRSREMGGGQEVDPGQRVQGGEGGQGGAAWLHPKRIRFIVCTISKSQNRHERMEGGCWMGQKRATALRR
jgi:hypothetical protein